MGDEGPKALPWADIALPILGERKIGIGDDTVQRTSKR
jgi:hypothetical protein